MATVVHLGYFLPLYCADWLNCSSNIWLDLLSPSVPVNTSGTPCFVHSRCLFPERSLESESREIIHGERGMAVDPGVYDLEELTERHFGSTRLFSPAGIEAHAFLLRPKAEITAGEARESGSPYLQNPED